MLTETRLNIFSILFFCIIAAVYPEAGYRKNSPISQSFRYALGRNNGTGFEPFRTTAQFIYTAEIPNANIKTGIQLTSGTFDFTADGIYWFARGNKFRTGIGALYHYLLFEKISATNDFMVGLYTQIHPFRPFIIDMNINIQYKIDQVFAIKTTNPWIWNLNPAFRGRLTYVSRHGTELYSEVASYEYFRYMLFLAPSFTFGVCYRWKTGLWAGAEICTRYTDMMTLSAYYDSTEIRSYLGFRF